MAGVSEQQMGSRSRVVRKIVGKQPDKDSDEEVHDEHMSENDFKDFMDWLKGTATDDDQGGSDTGSTDSSSATEGQKASLGMQKKPAIFKEQHFDEAPVHQGPSLAECSVCGKARSCN